MRHHIPRCAFCTHPGSVFAAALWLYSVAPSNAQALGPDEDTEIAAAGAQAETSAQQLPAPPQISSPERATPQDNEPALGMDRLSFTAADRIGVNVGASIVNQYISRGIAFSERPSLQISLRVDVDLPELKRGSITDARVFAGSWNSLQNGDPGLGQPSSGAFGGWYEADLYAGLAVEIRDQWAVQAAYYRYESPSHSFDGYNDLELIVTYQDARFWVGRTPLANFSLSPSLRIAQEVARPGRADALYVQPSLTVSFDLGDAKYPVRVAMPFVAGFSDDYFLDVDGKAQVFGYFRTGLTISGAPAPNIPALRMYGGFDLWLLNNRVANGLDDAEFVGQIGGRWSY